MSQLYLDHIKSLTPDEARCLPPVEALLNFELVRTLKFSLPPALLHSTYRHILTTFLRTAAEWIEQVKEVLLQDLPPSGIAYTRWKHYHQCVTAEKIFQVTRPPSQDSPVVVKTTIRKQPLDIQRLHLAKSVFVCWGLECDSSKPLTAWNEILSHIVQMHSHDSINAVLRNEKISCPLEFNIRASDAIRALSMTTGCHLPDSVKLHYFDLRNSRFVCLECSDPNQVSDLNVFSWRQCVRPIVTAQKGRIY